VAADEVGVVRINADVQVNLLNSNGSGRFVR
jgi:hypothetical protein